MGNQQSLQRRLTAVSAATQLLEAARKGDAERVKECIERRLKLVYSAQSWVSLWRVEGAISHGMASCPGTGLQFHAGKANYEHDHKMPSRKQPACRSTDHPVVHAQGGQTAWHIAARAGHAAVLQTMADTLIFGPAGPADFAPLLKLGRSTEQILQRLINVRSSGARGCCGVRRPCLTLPAKAPLLHGHAAQPAGVVC